MFLFHAPKIQKGRRTAKEKAALNHLSSFIDNNLEAPIQLLCGFWQDQQKALTYQEIREIIKYEKVPEKLLNDWMQDYTNLVRTKFTPVWLSAMREGAAGISNSGSFPAAAGQAMNPVSLSVADWIEKKGAAFVTSVTQEQKEAIKGLLAKKIVEQHTTDKLAKLIRPCVGLTKQQSEANLRYYNEVKETLRKDNPRMRKETIEKRARDAAAKYAERQHRYRAQMIADTEMAFAYNRGQEEWIRQMQQAGLMGPTERRWVTAGDSRVCKICGRLNGKQVAMEEEFSIPGRILFPGMHQTPPAHPNCRCTVQYVEVSGTLAATTTIPDGAATTDNSTGAAVPNTLAEGAATNIPTGAAETALPARLECVKIDNKIGEEERQQIIHELSMMPEPHRKMVVSELNEIRLSDRNSHMDKTTGILYMDSKLVEGEFIHEAAHILEREFDVYHNMNFVQILRQDMDQGKLIKDTTSFVEPIYRVISKNLVTKYQGRAYLEIEGVELMDENQELNPFAFAEYFAEAYRFHTLAPALLKMKNKPLYDFIEGLIL